MELDNSKGTFLAKLFLINIPVILLLGSGILAIFLIIHTWLPVILSGGLVLIGWVITLLFRLTFTRIRISEEKITILYYPIRILGNNYRKVELNREQFDGAELHKMKGSLAKSLVLFERAGESKAVYPPIPINLFSPENNKKLRSIFVNIRAGDRQHTPTVKKTSSTFLTFLLLTFSLFHFSTLPAQPRRLSITSLEETLHNGKVIRSSSEMYFDLSSGRIITMAKSPEEFVYSSDTEGKAEIYYPARNATIINQNLIFSTRNNNLWFFLNNQGYDLGLQGMGFRVLGLRNEDSYTITTWQAPLRYLKEVDKVDLVHENHLPVYLEYRNTKNIVTLKVYYSDFMRIGEAMIPTRVTEIVFTNPKDSTIRRSSYSNLLWGDQADKRGFEFAIPADAKKLK